MNSVSASVHITVGVPVRRRNVYNVVGVVSFFKKKTRRSTEVGRGRKGTPHTDWGRKGGGSFHFFGRDWRVQVRYRTTTRPSVEIWGVGPDRTSSAETTRVDDFPAVYGLHGQDE